MSVKALLNFVGDDFDLMTTLLEGLFRSETVNKSPYCEIFTSEIPDIWLKELVIELNRELSDETV